MANETEINPWEKLLELGRAGDSKALDAYVATLGSREAVRALLRLHPNDRRVVLTTLTPAEAAGLIEEIPDDHAADLIEALTPADAAPIVAEMQSSEQADLLGDLEAEDAEAILREMEPADAADARRLTLYDDDVAGGLMITEYLHFVESTTVGQAIDDLSKHAEEDEDDFTNYAYVVSNLDRLVGVLSVRSLALARRSVALADVMVPAKFVPAETSLDDLSDFFEQNDFHGVPVLDAHGKLLGVVTYEAVSDALAERSERDRLKMQGILGGDEIRTLPVLVRSLRRWSGRALSPISRIPSRPSSRWPFSCRSWLT